MIKDEQSKESKTSERSVNDNAMRSSYASLDSVEPTDANEWSAPQTDSEAYDTDLEDDEPKSYSNITPQEIYKQSCELFGVVPVSYFIKHMSDQTLSMKHHCIGPKGAKAMAAVLVINTSILDFDIEDNWITGEGAKDIAEMLLENCYIHTLNVANNKLGTLGAKSMCDMLVENTTLKSVNMSGNGFKDSDAEFFCDAFRVNFKLKEFNLSKNNFCEIGGEWLGQAIAANESIEDLDLSWNHLRLKGAIAVAAGMKININIKKLDLSWNGFADEGATAMAEALKTNNILCWLDLSHNRITGEGAKFLAKALLINDNLRMLKLGDNPIDPLSALALLRAIADNENSCIEDLDLTGVTVDEEFKRLAQELSKRTRVSDSITSFRYNVNRTMDIRTDFNAHGLDADPMDVIQDFLEKKRLRLIDLFRNFDKDQSRHITPDEFKKGILSAGIRMSKRQMALLMESLDVDVDGQVNYQEFLIGRKATMQKRREERKRREIAEKLKRAGEVRFREGWKEALRKAHSPSPRASPVQTPASSRPSSARNNSRSALKKTDSPTIYRNLLMVEPQTAVEKYHSADVDRTTPEHQSISPTDSPRRHKRTPNSRRISIPRNTTTPVKYKLKPTLKSTNE